MPSFDLTGRVAIVTGGNGGIGLGMASGLAEAGAAVVLSGRNHEKARAALDTIGARGGRSIFVAADVTQADACRNLVAEAVA
jgi:2-deoxy-D-gluconate 3-dehydrogenase